MTVALKRLGQTCCCSLVASPCHELMADVADCAKGVKLKGLLSLPPFE